MELGDATKAIEQLQDKINGVIFGQEPLVTEALCAFLAGGHILITGAPGLAKTTLVRVFAQKLGLQFGRIQFTPDLLPSDITGSEIVNMDPHLERRALHFMHGPIFVNLLLADEVNRASPRTQSAMLEAMQERKVTYGGREYPLPGPFMVFATQNPFESEGTFPLPEAQLDRFLLHTLVNYPQMEQESRMLREHAQNTLIGEAGLKHPPQEPPLSAELINDLLACAARVRIDEEIIQVVTELVRATRPSDPSCPPELRDTLWYGAGPRAGISLLSVAKSLALLEGQELVRWRHVRRLAKPVLRHRIRISQIVAQAEFNVDGFIDNLLQRLENQHKNLAKGLV